MEDDRISLAHGNGGRFMRELIEEVFARQLAASSSTYRPMPSASISATAKS